MSLDLLQSAILALRAAGDADTAAWLAEHADDPEVIAALTAKPAGDVEHFDPLESEQDRAEGDWRWLLEHGFTGTDRRGVKWVDGREVKSDAGADARTSTHTSHEQDATAAARQHDAAPEAERGAFGKAREAIHAKLSQSAGGRAVLAMGKGGAWVFHQLEHRLLYAAKKTQQLAVAAAKERGLSDEGAEKLKRALYVADFVGGYATGGAALAVAGPIAGKIAAIMPSASVAYLAYSTAKNPLATWKAAKKVVAETFAKGASVHESEEQPTSLTPELAGMIADRIDRSDVDSEWWVACFHAALAHTNGDAAKAVELADAAVEAMPQERNDEE